MFLQDSKNGNTLVDLSHQPEINYLYFTFITNAQFSNLILKLANKGGAEIINKIITNMSGFCAILGPNEMGVTCSNKSTMFLQKNFLFYLPCQSQITLTTHFAMKLFER